MIHQHNVELPNVWYKKVDHTPPCALKWTSKSTYLQLNEKLPSWKCCSLGINCRKKLLISPSNAKDKIFPKINGNNSWNTKSSLWTSKTCSFQKIWLAHLYIFVKKSNSIKIIPIRCHIWNIWIFKKTQNENEN
jgi:hypothetical protein